MIDRLPSITLLAAVMIVTVWLVSPAMNEKLPEVGVMSPGVNPLACHGTMTGPTLPPVRVTVSITGEPSVTV